MYITIGKEQKEKEKEKEKWLWLWCWVDGMKGPHE